MKLIVGTNLRADSLGALELAAWIRQHTTDVGSVDVTALAILRDLGDFGDGSSFRTRVQDALEAFVEDSAAHAAVSSFQVEIAPRVAPAIVEYAKANGDALILGRAAPRENTRLIRLGSVARRALRRLRVPTFVVPPDWNAAVAGRGPVVVAVDASSSSLSALAFAQQLASSVSRPMLAVQAVQGLSPLGSAFLAPAEFASLRDRHRAQEVEALRAHLAEHGHASLNVRSEPGPTVDTLLDVAEDVDAIAVVCGSRQLSLSERIVSASVGSELAALAAMPVVLVPPDFAATLTSHHLP